MTYASGRPLIEPLNISVYGGEFMIMDLFAFLTLAVMVYLTGFYRDRGRRDDRMFFAMLIGLMISAITDAAEYGVGFLLSGRDNPVSETFSFISYVFLRAVPAIMVLYFGYRYNRNEEWLKKHTKPVAVAVGITTVLLIVSYVIFLVKGEYIYDSGSGIETVIFVGAVAISLVFELHILRLLYLNNKRLLPYVFLPLFLVIIMLIPVGVMLYTVILVFIHIDEMNRGFYGREGGRA